MLTAAHCVNGNKAEDITVYLGLDNIQDPSQAKHQSRIAQIHTTDPGFNTDTYENDIVLFEMETPVPFYQEGVEPACLASQVELFLRLFLENKKIVLFL